MGTPLRALIVEDSPDDTELLLIHLRRSGYDVSYREFAGNHTYICWRGTIADGVVALFGRTPKLAAVHAPKPTRRPPVDITPATQSTLSLLARIAIVDGGASALAEAKKLLATNPNGYALDEDEINAAGCMLLMLDHARESLPLFLWNTQRFAKSWNTWDSLAWAYLMIGDRQNAVKNFKQELVLDPLFEIVHTHGMIL